MCWLKVAAAPKDDRAEIGHAASSAAVLAALLSLLHI